MTTDKRETIRDHAEAIGESLNAYINHAIDEALLRDRPDYVPDAGEKE